jgi:hypothetical protein
VGPPLVPRTECRRLAAERWERELAAAAAALDGTVAPAEAAR